MATVDKNKCDQENFKIQKNLYYKTIYPLREWFFLKKENRIQIWVWV